MQRCVREIIFCSVSLFFVERRCFFIFFPAFGPASHILIWLPWQQSSSNQNISTSFHLTPPLCRALSVYINCAGDETSEFGHDLVRPFLISGRIWWQMLQRVFVVFFPFFFFFLLSPVCGGRVRKRPAELG